MSHSVLKDISHIKYLDRLLYLDISHSNIPDNIIESVNTSDCLQYLDASHNILRECPNLSAPTLYEIHLESNMIYRLRLDSWLFNLKHLYLADNQIMDVIPLAMCPFLQTLDLSHNLIKGGLEKLLIT